MQNRLSLKITLLFCFHIWLCLSVQAQDILLQGWYWDYPKTCAGNNWANTLENQAVELGEAGFTHVWLPPMSRASFGSCSNGYDVRDLYDLGEFGLGATQFGTRNDVDLLISNLNVNGIEAVADVVYNHRDGGTPENNPAVKDYITIHYNAAKNPFPSDRFRCVLPLGADTGNGAGDYYFKVSSKTGDSQFHNKAYTFRVETNVTGSGQNNTSSETEPNGGGDCGQGFTDAPPGVTVQANVDASGCTVDEFKVTLDQGDFDANGDMLYIYLTNPNGDYSDHRVYGLWSSSLSADIVDQIDYQTYTDFTQMPSGKGAMNFENFRPNSSNAATAYIDGDWETLLFFYDYDQSSPSTQTELFNWTKWLWNDVGIRGLRMDAVKHFDPAFVGDLMDEMHDAGQIPSLVTGEYFDGNPYALQSWIDGVYANMDNDTQEDISVKVFDFALRYSIKDACDWSGYDLRSLYNAGMVNGAGSSGFNVITFINNHDFRDFGQPIQNDPILAYAYILTNNQIGLPSVYYSDYYGVNIPNAPTQFLKPAIDRLIEIQQDYITGSSSVDYLNRFSTPYGSNYMSGSADKTLLYQLSSGIAGLEVIVAINFSDNPLIVDHAINTSNLMTGDALTDLVGNAFQSETTIDNNGQIRIEIPARSYTVWANTNCLAELTLNDIYVNPGTYQVGESIISGGIIETGTEVNYKAGQVVELQNNFSTEQGSVFSVEIDGCN